LSDGTELSRPIRHPNVCDAEPAPSFRLLELQGAVIHRVVTSEGASLTRSLSLERKWVVDAPTERSWHVFCPARIGTKERCGGRASAIARVA
jgi:hypothetical protein